MRGGSWLAILECDLPRRPGQLFLGIGLLPEDSLSQNREPARRGEGRDLAAGGEQPFLGQQLAYPSAQFGFRRGNHPSRYFFETDFE